QGAAEETKPGKFTPRRLADMQGAVPREKWSFAGFATPETTVQTFFAAIASGDPEQIIRCLPPRDAERMRQEMARDPQGSGKNFLAELDRMGKVSAFRITGTRNIDESHSEVLVQVVADGESMPLPIQRVGDEWKLGQ